MENWRFIEANSDYMVSDHGRILSFKGKSKLIISSSITAKGYEYVAIRQKGIYVGYSVHRLVAVSYTHLDVYKRQAFSVGSPPPPSSTSC